MIAAQLGDAHADGVGELLMGESTTPRLARSIWPRRTCARRGDTYMGSNSKISTAHEPSRLARNGKSSVSAAAAARSSASTIV